MKAALKVKIVRKQVKFWESISTDINFELENCANGENDILRLDYGLLIRMCWEIICSLTGTIYLTEF